MEVKRCAKGHFYDAETNASCPQCAAEQGNSYGPTEPVFGAVGGNAYGATEPVFGAGGVGDYGATEPVRGAAGLGETEPVIGGNGFDTMDFSGGTSKVENYDDATQPVNPGGITGFTPVTGWLVCIEGADRGNDYHIRAGYNYIGRGEHMDICIRGDMKIGRDRHALIGYDHEERIFFFGPADGKSILRVNGKMVMSPQEIQAYDILTIGSTKLMFVPLCGERFNWNE